VSGAELALALLKDPGFDPAGEVLIEAPSAESAPGPADPGVSAPAGAGETVDVLSYRPEEVRLQVTMGSAGYLVLADADYPGWRAAVDGQPAPIRRADLYFRAVELQAGQHQVVFRFEPEPVRWGLAVSLAAWATLALAVPLAVYTGRKTSSSV
jgi:hypothetical protein